MNLSLVNDREGFRFHVTDVLAREPVDYLAEFELIDERRKVSGPGPGEGFSCRSISVKTETRKELLLAITSLSSANDPRTSNSPATSVLQAVEFIRY